MEVTRCMKIDTDIDNMQVGDKIQVSLGELGNITATVHEVNDNEVILMFDKCIDCKPMYHDYSSVTYRRESTFEDTDLYKWLNVDLLNQLPDVIKESIKYVSIPTYGQIYGHGTFPYETYIESDNDKTFPIMKEEIDMHGLQSFWLRNVTYTDQPLKRFASTYTPSQLGFTPADYRLGVRPIFALNKHKNGTAVNISQEYISQEENFKYYLRWMQRFLCAVYRCWHSNDANSLVTLANILSRIDINTDFTINIKNTKKEMEHLAVKVLTKLISTSSNGSEPFLVKHDSMDDIYRVNQKYIDLATDRITLDDGSNFKKYLKWFHQIKGSIEDIFHKRQQCIIYLIEKIDNDYILRITAATASEECGVSINLIRSILNSMQDRVYPVFIGEYDENGMPIYLYDRSHAFMYTGNVSRVKSKYGPLLSKRSFGVYEVDQDAIKEFY